MKKAKTKSETRYTARVYAYINPEKIYPVPTDRHWYWEGKILYSGKENGVSFIIGYQEGFKVKWSVFVYVFHSISKARVPKLITYLKERPQHYAGYLHHINLYGGITGKFIEQIKISQ